MSDVLTIRTPGGKYIDIEVLGLCNKSIAAKEAILLYDIKEKKLTSDEQELLQLFDQAVKLARPRYKGRPTKRERRSLEKFKRQSDR